MRSKFKFLLVLTILLLGCVCVGSTFAADVSVSNVDDTINLESIDDSSQKDVEINNLQAGEGNFTELQKAVDDATGTLILKKDYKYVSEDNMKDGVLINKSLIIDGQGHTLDASNLAKIFLVNASDVTLKNINFINAYSMDDGGAIFLFLGHSCNITDCNFTNCNCFADGVERAGYNGGAIYVDGTATISNCNFDSCTTRSDVPDMETQNGGAIYVDLDGAAVIMDCNFTRCDAGNWGGAIYFASDNAIVTGCSFINNHADGCGGALTVCGLNNIISDCNFVSNIAGPPFGSMASCGGAIYFDEEANGSVDNCNFVNNSAICYSSRSTVGGAIHGFNGISVTDCFFKDNYAKAGGAIDLGSNCIIGGCNFINCSSERSGGAISLMDNNSVSDCSFVNCSAYNSYYGYGGAIDLDENNSVIGCSFVNNYAPSLGGAISSGEGLVISGCNFINDTTFSISKGTVNFVHGKNLTGYINIKYLEDEIDTKSLEGNITVTINSVDYQGVIDNNGKFIIYGTDSLDVSDYENVLIRYVHDVPSHNGYHYAISTANFTIVKAVPSIDINVKSSNLNVSKFVEGDDVIVTVTLPKDATGFVLISVDGGKWIKAPVVKGVAEYTFKGLKAGNHTFLVKYPGDDNYLPVATTADITITKKTNPNPNPTNHSGIPMEHTGNPLIALLFALIILPILRRK